MRHKLIIAQRRTGKDKDSKKEKDLQQCSVLSEVAQAEEVQQILAGYWMSREVQRQMETVLRRGGNSCPRGAAMAEVSKDNGKKFRKPHR